MNLFLLSSFLCFLATQMPLYSTSTEFNCKSWPLMETFTQGCLPNFCHFSISSSVISDIVVYYGIDNGNSYLWSCFLNSQAYKYVFSINLNMTVRKYNDKIMSFLWYIQLTFIVEYDFIKHFICWFSRPFWGFFFKYL